MTTMPLPGMEDVNAPPEVSGWEYALWKVRNKPARSAVVEALRRLARGAAQCYPCNETVLAEVNKSRPMKLRALTITLAQLDHEDRLVERSLSPHSKSRRRLRFTFLGHPPSTPVKGAQVTCAHGRKEVAPPAPFKSLRRRRFRRRRFPLLIQFRIQKGIQR